MIHPNTEVRLIDAEIGHGLFATSRIPCGTITWVLDPLDRVISPQKMREYDEKYQEILMTYSFRDQEGDFVFCWDNGRFINHSFKANCCATPYKFEVAIRDIEAGEEITNDYGTLNIIESFEPRDEGTDRKMVHPDDLVHYAALWDEKLQKSFAHLMQVEQPLQKYLENKVWVKVENVCLGREKLLSLRNNYYLHKG